MPPRRCDAPGCGRFISSRSEFCPRHTGNEKDDDSLHAEILALRHVLHRLIQEVDDIDMLARYIPRVSNVAIQAAKARHQIGARGRDDLMALLGPVLEELDAR